jgi:hypothetical protein
VKRNACRVLIGKRKETTRETWDLGGRIILKWNMGRYGLD